MSAAPSSSKRWLNVQLDRLVVRRLRSSATVLALALVSAVVSTFAMVPVSAVSAWTIGGCWLAIMVSLVRRHHAAWRVLATLRARPESIVVHDPHCDMVRLECGGASIEVALTYGTAP